MLAIVSVRVIIRSFFLQTEDGVTETVNQELYEQQVKRLITALEKKIAWI